MLDLIYISGMQEGSRCVFKEEKVGRHGFPYIYNNETEDPRSGILQFCNGVPIPVYVGVNFAMHCPHLCI
eukprot:355289-Pelagomonas_calceolata.AAC.1